MNIDATQQLRTFKKKQRGAAGGASKKSPAMTAWWGRGSMRVRADPHGLPPEGITRAVTWGEETGTKPTGSKENKIGEGQNRAT